MNIPTFSACPFCGKPVKVRVQFSVNCVYVGCEKGCAHMRENIKANTLTSMTGLNSLERPIIDDEAEAFLDAYDAALQKLADRWNMRGGFVERAGG